MKRSFFVILFSILTIGTYCQTISSVNLIGGLIIPSGSQVGTSVCIEASTKINDSWSLYFTPGFSNWGKKYVYLTNFNSELTSYSEDNHRMYLFSAGAKLVITTIKTFKIYVNMEIGYNYLKYYSYLNYMVTDPSTNKITSFYVDNNSKKEISENLFGFGFGLGLTQKISDSFSFLVEYKRNTMTENFKSLRSSFTLNTGIVFNM